MSSSQCRPPQAAQLAQVIQVTRLEMLEVGATLIKFSYQDQTLKLLFVLEDDADMTQHQTQMTNIIWRMKVTLNDAHISIVEIYQPLQEQSQSECVFRVDLNASLQPIETDPFLQLSRGLCLAR
ncbi:MAG: hypothetical protein ACO3NK_06515 [Prochlorotrichaceae cyanobacterium]|jgi:hypothetical protein